MKTRVEFVPGSATRLSEGKVQISFAYLEDDVVVKLFSRALDMAKPLDDEAVRKTAEALLPFAESRWGSASAPKSDKAPEVEAAFDQVAAVREAEAAEVKVVKEAPVYEPRPKPVPVPVEEPPVEEPPIVEGIEAVK